MNDNYNVIPIYSYSSPKDYDYHNMLYCRAVTVIVLRKKEGSYMYIHQMRE